MNLLINDVKQIVYSALTDLKNWFFYKIQEEENGTNIKLVKKFLDVKPWDDTHY